MSSIETSEPVVKTRTEPMSARPSADCRTAARPNGFEPVTGGNRAMSVLLSGAPDQASTVTFAKDETHIDTLACGAANVIVNGLPPNTSSERSLSWSGASTVAQSNGAAAAARRSRLTPDPQNPSPVPNPGAVMVTPAPAKTAPSTVPVGSASKASTVGAG